MAASFLQFCATCEKQITIPSNAVLYCSASCRDHDSQKPLAISLLTFESLSPTTPSLLTPPFTPSLSPEINTPIMEATRCHTPCTSHPHPYYHHNVPTIRLPPSDLHQAKTDLDPTEWKPKIHSPARMMARSAESTAAFKYLAQFQRHLPPAATSPTPSTEGECCFNIKPCKNSTNKSNDKVSSVTTRLSSSYHSTATTANDNDDHDNENENTDSMHSPVPSLVHSPFTIAGASPENSVTASIPHPHQSYGYKQIYMHHIGAEQKTHLHNTALI